jgi:hypothetical protein
MALRCCYWLFDVGHLSPPSSGVMGEGRKESWMDIDLQSMDCLLGVHSIEKDE